MGSLPLLVLTDARFPAGGYAHSGGLEQAVEDGLGVDGTVGFLYGRIRGVARMEAMVAVAAARAARAGDLPALLELDLEAAARCPSAPLRKAASRLGSQLLRTAASVWPGSPLVPAYRGASRSTPRPVAFGVVAAVAGLDDLDTARAFVYEDAASVTTAAVRLLPVDGGTAARWLVEAEPELDRAAREAAGAGGDPRRWPGGFTPALELGSLAHAAREGRLFAS
jgi:urease accessory protein